ncbi:MAG TPA: M14 family zinc carboxypeptidase, partial [Rhodothermales bacterium]|nr:M14 family zinc carboxypeptidase [Rhodothermales bacterium]
MRSFLVLPLALLALSLFPSRGASAQERAPERYVEVRLSAASPDALRAGLDAAGVQLDHAAWDRSGATLALRTVLSASELAALQGAAVGVEVLDADVAATYAQRAAASQARAGGCPTTPYPVTGSMACYPTYAEVLAILDQMRTEYPGLITVRTSIGQTGEGRDMWMVELSDNPGVDEGEPEVLFTALHHAREPEGIVTVLHYLWDLLEGYGTDPEATYLLRSRRIYVVPMMNPDGYEYNRTE